MMIGQDVSGFGPWRRSKTVIADGRALRDVVPLASHAELPPRVGGFDVVGWVNSTDTGRIPALVPIRIGRMAANPFAFIRGSAGLMAADLATTANSGIFGQICGDAHAANFGFYATADHDQLFGLNDFDETMVGPWEWDLKRLAGSIEIAGRQIAVDQVNRSQAVLDCVRGYCLMLADRSSTQWRQAWSIADYRLTMGKLMSPGLAKTYQKAVAEAGRATSQAVTAKIAPDWTIVQAPPLLRRIGGTVGAAVRQGLLDYLAALPAERSQLLSRFAITDMGLRVVGTGSVGLASIIVILRGNDDESLVLQVKEARDSVLRPHLGAGPFTNNGERVVRGQRRMVLSGDPLLGWTTVDGDDCYVRQFRDLKGGIDPLTLKAGTLAGYARLVGAHLALAHAYSMDPRVLSGYCGRGGTLGKALVGFAKSAADRNEADHADLVKAVKAGRLPAEMGV